MPLIVGGKMFCFLAFIIEVVRQWYFQFFPYAGCGMRNEKAVHHCKLFTLPQIEIILTAWTSRDGHEAGITKEDCRAVAVIFWREKV
jgi:hypothetical protein